MALKQFQTQDGVRISNTPGSIQIDNRTMHAGDAVKINVGNSEYFAMVNRANNSDDGVESSAVAYDSANNMITLHISEVQHPSTNDILIISKFDSGGNLLWQKQMTDDVDSDISHDVCIDPNDNIVVVTSDDKSGPDVLVVIKMDPGGNVLWVREYQANLGLFPNSFQELGAAVCNDESIFLAGEFIEDEEQDFLVKGLIMKINLSDGGLNWVRTLQLDEDITRLYGMDVTSEGHVVVVGTTGIPEGGPTAAFATKFLSDGTQAWTTGVLDIELGVQYAGADVVVDTQGNCIISVNSRQTIVHETGNNTLVSIVHVIKLDSTGRNVIWARRIGPGPCASVATGIDCDGLGNIYMNALTVAQPNPVRDENTYFDAKNVLALVKYSPSGQVIWQRNIEAQGYQFYDERDGGTPPPGEYDYDLNRGRYLSLSSSGKLAVQVTVKPLDLDDNIPGSRYWESITFQLDQDGRPLTLGSGNELFTVKESRIPGRFVTVPTLTGSEGTVVDITSSFTQAVISKTFVEGLLAQQLARTASYDYSFGNDGTVTIPNDGDLRLTQTQIGWFSILGPAINNIEDVWIRASCVDSETGDVYAVGQEDNTGQGFVVRYNGQGQVLWSVRLNDLDNGNNVRCNAVKITRVNRRIAVLCEYYGAETGVLLIQIDPDTAEIVYSDGFRDQNEDNGVNAYDFDFFSDGSPVVVGRKFDEYFSLAVTPQSGSTTSVLVVSNAAIEAGSAVHPVENSWSVTGTGITGRAGIVSINRYDGVTGTTRQGSGALFTITNNGDGTYAGNAVDAPGTNYLIGHKILVPGTSLGGTSPTNNCVVEVQSVDEGGGVLTFAVSGTAAGSTVTIYENVGGTNHQVGSGLQFDFIYDLSYDGATTGNVQTGSNYVLGDRITFAGTSLGGASPTNDLIVEVTAVGPGGEAEGLSFSGTAQTTIRKLTVDQAVDFGGVGTWSVGYDLGGEAFVWTDGWSKVLSAGGQNDTERYLSVAVDANNNVYAAGEMISRDGAAGPDLEDIWCAVVSKFNQSGTHQWTKALNDTIDNCYAKGVAVNGNVVAVTFENSGLSRTVITKLDTTGTIKWQRYTDSGDDSSVAVDSNGDIYVVAEANFENKYESVIKAMRLASNGEPIWRKFFGTLSYEYGGTDEYFKNGRNLTIDDTSLYVSGYTTAFDDNYENGFLVKLPKSGDCDGYYGIWTVQAEMYGVSLVTSTDATDFTPVIGTGNFEYWEPDFETNWWDPSDNNSYHTLQEIRDRDGGAIEFADGTRQTSSAQIIPQVKISNGADHRLTQEDAGKHIYVTSNSSASIIVPYHQDNPLPIGFTVVIVNNSGGTIDIDADGGGISIIVPGDGSAQYWDLEDEGMATLLKVDEFVWFLTGNVSGD